MQQLHVNAFTTACNELVGKFIALIIVMKLHVSLNAMQSSFQSIEFMKKLFNFERKMFTL